MDYDISNSFANSTEERLYNIPDMHIYIFRQKKEL